MVEGSEEDEESEGDGYSISDILRGGDMMSSLSSVHRGNGGGSSSSSQSRRQTSPPLTLTDNSGSNSLKKSQEARVKNLERVPAEVGR